MSVLISTVLEEKKLDLLTILDVHQPQLVAIQETKNDSSITTSELFQNLAHTVFIEKTGMFTGMVNKDIGHMPIAKLDDNSESVWVKVFVNKTSHYIASWYRQPNGTSSEDFQLFRDKLEQIRNKHEG